MTKRERTHDPLRDARREIGRLYDDMLDDFFQKADEVFDRQGVVRHIRFRELERATDSDLGDAFADWAEDQ